ncbi:hypothetical protein [Pedobacter sp.]|uniref:hypothetical protein n=1 Tax=Pedobacter sp. TaxID=1411316 RepID=UPI003C48A7D9
MAHFNFEKIEVNCGSVNFKRCHNYVEISTVGAYQIKDLQLAGVRRLNFLSEVLKKGEPRAFELNSDAGKIDVFGTLTAFGSYGLTIEEAL